MSDSYPTRHSESSLSIDTLSAVKGHRHVFVETGSHLGHGIQVALDCGFAAIASIDRVPEFFNHCLRRFADQTNVVLKLGHSAMFLAKFLPTLSAPAVIYLDAHGSADNPLLEELRAIEEHTFIRDHVILIDDVRMFGTPEWFGIELVDALEILHRINPRYSFSYMDTPNGPGDLLVAQVL